MKVGVVVPLGQSGEYAGWDPVTAWGRTMQVARQAEDLGFESVWVYDHVQTLPEPRDEITFESFMSLAHLGAVTTRVRLGHLVMSAGFRNPALTAKMISTLDVHTGGRMELGIGTGWNRFEWEAYGYGFPSARDRLGALRDQLEVLTAMMAPGRASYSGQYASVADAVNLPGPVQVPRVPIMVGGNGPKVTWRLAARFADELNIDGLMPEDVAEALPVVRDRCEEIGRDPDSLRVSAHVYGSNSRDEGRPRVELLTALRELGICRVMTPIRAASESDEALVSFAEDCRAAGAELASPMTGP
ncbi:MAG: TIGR03560 family F420-dependent LLM class oxidoreductase [Acidimicrobiia bacterium]